MTSEVTALRRIINAAQDALASIDSVEHSTISTNDPALFQQVKESAAGIAKAVITKEAQALPHTVTYQQLQEQGGPLPKKTKPDIPFISADRLEEWNKQRMANQPSEEERLRQWQAARVLNGLPPEPVETRGPVWRKRRS